MLPLKDVQQTIERHATDVQAITVLLRNRPDLIVYARGMLHDLGGLASFEIAQILYACALEPEMFALIRDTLEDFTEHIPQEHHPAKPFSAGADRSPGAPGVRS